MMNGNNAPNVKDLRETVFEAASTFLTSVSATEIADLVVDAIETADCLELIDDGVTWERVETPADSDIRFEGADVAALYDRFGRWAA